MGSITRGKLKLRLGKCLRDAASPGTEGPDLRLAPATDLPALALQSSRLAACDVEASSFLGSGIF